jgi:type I restriction enzyme S subunit
VRDNGGTAELPAGWARASLAEIAEINPSLGRDVPDDTTVSFVPMAAVEERTGHLDGSAVRKFGEVKKGFTRFRDGDLVFAKITPSMENGKIALATRLENGIGCGTTELHVIRPWQGISGRYLLHYLLQSSFREIARRNMKGTAGQLRVSADFLAGATVPVAPPGEQERIVAKIDELFSDIEEGERCLARAEALLKQYRQAVLKAAVTGELTRDWRERNKGKGETGADLLRRVLQTRRDAWARTQNSAYRDPSIPDATGLSQIPEGWMWAALEMLESEPTKNGISIKGRDRPPGVPALRLDSIQGGRLNYQCRRYIDLDAERVSRLRIVAGDFFVSRANGSKNLCGRAAVAGEVGESYRRILVTEGVRRQRFELAF